MFGFGKKKRAVEEPDRSTIVPRIKHTNFVAALNERGVPPDQMPVTEPLLGDLIVTYAFDLPDRFQMVSAAMAARLSLGPSELREVATSNLRRKMPRPELRGEPPLLLLSTGQDLEACMLLLGEFWDRLATTIPGGLVVAVPSRDVVLITSGESQRGLEQVRELAGEARAREPVHGLSEHLFIWRGGNWHLYDAA